MTTDGRLARAVPFPEFAPDHVLRFTTGDLIALESLYSVKDDALGAVPWTKEIERRIAANDATFVREAVKIGVKKPGGFERPDLKDVEWDDLPFSPAAITQKLFDAILCAITGCAYAEILQDRAVAEGAAAQTA